MRSLSEGMTRSLSVREGVGRKTSDDVGIFYVVFSRPIRRKMQAPVSLNDASSTTKYFPPSEGVCSGGI